MPAKYTEEERITAFWQKVYITDTCWLWRGGLYSNGYGHFNVERRPVLAHRFAYEQLVGAIPERMVIDHLCRVRSCVNVNHLEVVTRQVNTLRGVGLSAQRARQTHCVKGHEFNIDNTYITPNRNGNRQCLQCRGHRDAFRIRHRKDEQ